MSRKDMVKQKIAEKNHWYIDSQLEAASSNAQRRIIQQRITFILETVAKLEITSPVILDAGCGDGLILKELQKISEAVIWGVDYNPWRLARAKKLAPQIHYKEASLDSLDFADEYFDVIVMNQVLEHIQEDEQVLKEMRRLLKNRGVFILGVPNEGCFLARLRNNLIQPEIRKNTDHVHFYTVGHLQNILRKNKFKIISIWQQSFFTPYTRLSNRLAANAIGFKLLEYLARILPSQCASIYLVCRKD